MTKNNNRPFFLGGAWHGKPEFLFEEPGCDILKNGDRINLTVWGPKPWSKHYVELARKYKVNFVSLRALGFGKRQTAEFLLDMQILRGASISLIRPKDLSALAQLRELQFLSIDLG
jgi:hypothetical protein